MCLLIVQNKNARVTESQFEETWKRNNDGVGYAFVKNGEIKIKKFMKLKPFKKAINSDVKRYGSESAFLIHFRYTTHGLPNLENCHPFRIDENSVFGHNGCITSVDNDLKLSDTRVFNNTILRDLPSNWYESKSIKMLVSDFIGSSKLAFLNSDGSYVIINEHKFGGHWNKLRSIWFSNDNYKKREPIVYHRNYTNYSRINNFSSVADKVKDVKKTFAEDEFLTCEKCKGLTDILIKFENKNICEPCENESNNQSNFNFK